MMMTAIMIFLGLSACATLSILAAFVLNARSSVVGAEGEMEVHADAREAARGSKIVPAFSH
jgi:hypothetical protein